MTLGAVFLSARYRLQMISHTPLSAKAAVPEEVIADAAGTNGLDGTQFPFGYIFYLDMMVYS